MDDSLEPPPSSSHTTKHRESLSSNVSASRKEQEIREKLASLPGAEVAGYMPLREDFDTEHNNDAEQLLVDMEFLADDHPSERLMKLKVIEIYNQRLNERDERKKFVIERGIIDVKRQQQVRLVARHPLDLSLSLTFCLCSYLSLSLSLSLSVSVSLSLSLFLCLLRLKRSGRKKKEISSRD
jgi:hypothetical protein